MNDIKSIESFNESEIEAAEQHSPAIKRYLALLKMAPQNFGDQLRLQRHNAWVVAGINTLFFPKNTKNICLYWSKATDQLLTQAFNYAGLHEEQVLLVAMGKLGAEELNLSSDIDIIFISKNPPHQELIKKVQKFTRVLNETTPFGFCFRIDYDLRPGGRFGALISSIQQLQDYYWSQGETWERMAFIRSRPICGDNAIAQELKEFLARFCYRKFIDFTLFEDLRNLRQKIQSHNFNAYENYNDIHLKLTPGGIRDLELFLHAHAIIHGGKFPEIRTKKTDELYYKLNQIESFKNNIHKNLADSYWDLRSIENRIQLINDLQTHILNLDQNKEKLTSEEIQKLKDELIDNNKIVSSLLGDIKKAQETLPESFEEQKQFLLNLGFSEATINQIWTQLITLKVKSKNQSRDEAARKLFLYLFVTELAEININKDLGLALLYDFVKSTHAKASFFTLLNREPLLIKNLARLFSTSPYLGGIISSRPELLDSYLYRYQQGFSNSLDEALEEMAERRLLTELIASTEFLANKNVDPLCESLTQTADEICSHLLKLLIKEHGESELMILALGKWGGRELGLTSDLDFIFITPNEPNEVDYKIAKRFISRLQDQHKGGKIYSIDLRLRPSGNSGPLLISKDRLHTFLTLEAEPWQRQSYLRARCLTKFISTEEIQNWCTQRPLLSMDVEELKRIRSKLITPNSEDYIDFKFSAGGLVDIEFSVQQFFLAHNLNPITTNTSEMILKTTLSQSEAQELVAIYNYLRTLEQFYQLLSQLTGSKIHLKSSSITYLLSVYNIKTTEELVSTCQKKLDRSLQILKQIDPSTMIK